MCMFSYLKIIKTYESRHSGAVNTFQDTFDSCDHRDDTPHSLVDGKKPQEDRKQSIFCKSMW